LDDNAETFILNVSSQAKCRVIRHKVQSFSGNRFAML
jgi:hypothetical protein